MAEKSCTSANNCAGFTIIELLMVVVIVSIMMGVAIPYLMRSSDRGGVTEAVVAMSTLHARAKLASIQRGRVTRLKMSTSRATMWIVANTATGSGLDTIGPVEDLGSRFGVTFRTSRDSLVFTPRGIGTETSGTTIIVSKGTAADTITVSAAGRLIH